MPQPCILPHTPCPIVCIVSIHSRFLPLNKRMHNNHRLLHISGRRLYRSDELDSYYLSYLLYNTQYQTIQSKIKSSRNRSFLFYYYWEFRIVLKHCWRHLFLSPLSFRFLCNVHHWRRWHEQITLYSLLFLYCWHRWPSPRNNPSKIQSL